MKSPPFQIVEISWVDSASMSGWRATEEVLGYKRGAVYALTVGYLVRETKDEVMVTQSRHDLVRSADPKETEDRWGNIITIPRCCIKRLRRLAPLLLLLGLLVGPAQAGQYGPDERVDEPNPTLTYRAVSGKLDYLKALEIHSRIRYAQPDRHTYLKSIGYSHCYPERGRWIVMQQMGKK